jgi:hypothetical protein
MSVFVQLRRSAAVVVPLLLLVTLPASAQLPGSWLSDLPQAKDYVQHRASSYDRSGANADARVIAPGETLTLLDESGPGLITHLWVTISSDDVHHLKALVLRMYWDGEPTPSVEIPSGIFSVSAWAIIFFINLFLCPWDPTRG